MQSLIQWLMGLGNPETMIAAGISFAIGYVVTNAFYGKAKDTLKDIEILAHDINDGDADDKWTKEELAKVIADIKHIVGDYKK